MAEAEGNKEPSKHFGLLYGDASRRNGAVRFVDQVFLWSDSLV